MGFTFNDISSDSFGIVVKTVTYPLVPAAKVNSFTPQFRDGSLDFDASGDGRIFYEDKTIELQLQIKAKNLGELKTKCKQIAGWLQGSGELYFDDEPNKVYKAKIQQSIDFVPQILGRYANMTVYFRVPPFADGKTIFEEITLSAGEATILKVTNSGDGHANARIALSGTGDGTVNIATMQYAGSIDNVTINNGTQTITQNGNDVTFRSNFGFFSLAPGVTRIPISSDVDVAIIFYYEPKYF